ncbi:hypothetical protein LAZ67_6002185 [Cordylochernes scorpioides]|uniref:Transposase n=1 Tax=Cordylochernes scorpioides TaxID=51811 RepID=A0ABY6KKP3_9ARAC|nr:hypothetical protein LAZ67_6002185 [Cordylochernes scorpioides]
MTKFPKINCSKIKEAVLIGSQIRKLINNEEFIATLKEDEKNAWLTLIDVVKHFLGNNKLPDYARIVENIISKFHNLECITNLKFHFMDSHLNYFPDNLGAESENKGERFHQEKISGNTVVPISRRYVRVRQSYSNLFKGYTLRCGDFTMEQKLKQRICIEICVKLQIQQPKLLKCLIKHSPMTPQKEQVFLNDILDLKLAEFLLKIILGKNAQNVQNITDLIKENPRTTLLELEQNTGISKTTIGRIVTKDLKLKKTPAKFIPRFLTNEKKLCRLATCENMLEMTRTDPEWKDKIITGDETWVYDYDPETKRQYAEWRGQGEPRPKKSRILKSRNKVLLVAFLDNKGIVHHEYLPAGQTVIKEMYLDILRHLREAIRKKNAIKMA